MYKAALLIKSDELKNITVVDGFVHLSIVKGNSTPIFNYLFRIINKDTQDLMYRVAFSQIVPINNQVEFENYSTYLPFYSYEEIKNKYKHPHVWILQILPEDWTLYTSGIFNKCTWNNSHICWVPKYKYKKLSSDNEITELNFNQDIPRFYVDGSYRNNIMGYAGYLVINNKIHNKIKGVCRPEEYDLGDDDISSITAEIISAIKAIKKARELKINKMAIFYDCENIRLILLGQYGKNTKTDANINFRNLFLELTKDIEIIFVKIIDKTTKSFGYKVDQLAKSTTEAKPMICPINRIDNSDSKLLIISSYNIGLTLSERELISDTINKIISRNNANCVSTTFVTKQPHRGFISKYIYDLINDINGEIDFYTNSDSYAVAQIVAQYRQKDCIVIQGKYQDSYESYLISLGFNPIIIYLSQTEYKNAAEYKKKTKVKHNPLKAYDFSEQEIFDLLDDYRE